MILISDEHRDYIMGKSNGRAIALDRRRVSRRSLKLQERPETTTDGTISLHIATESGRAGSDQQAADTI